MLPSRFSVLAVETMADKETLRCCLENFFFGNFFYFLFFKGSKKQKFDWAQKKFCNEKLT